MDSRLRHAQVPAAWSSSEVRYPQSPSGRNLLPPSATEDPATTRVWFGKRTAAARSVREGGKALLRTNAHSDFADRDDCPAPVRSAFVTAFAQNAGVESRGESQEPRVLRERGYRQTHMKSSTGQQPRPGRCRSLAATLQSCVPSDVPGDSVERRHANSARMNRRP